MAIIVTGGAGFIGSALVRHLIETTDETIVNVDKLTYAGDLFTVSEVTDSPRYVFEQADIADSAAMSRVFATHAPTAVFNLAAESHVDRSIDDPTPFLQTNVLGTFTLLEAARTVWDGRSPFRFLHVSTDEVFGSLGADGAFAETTPYDPSSPYSASKAASDHLVRAWHRTYGLPALITNCSNNYGPYQFPEKLIPLMIMKGMAGEPMPVYGAGDQVRDWLYVDDHVRALTTVLDEGQPGETYNIGGHNERKNLEVVETICAILDQEVPGRSHRELISFVTDRPGHDQRYAIDNSKITTELGWQPQESFESGLTKTVRWIIDHQDWYQTMGYGGERLGHASSGSKP